MVEPDDRTVGGSIPNLREGFTEIVPQGSEDLAACSVERLLHDCAGTSNSPQTPVTSSNADIDDALRAERSERLRVEEQLRAANERLARNQRDLLDALEGVKKSHDALMQTQLQLIHAERLDSAGRLAAGVAHEVKNPLAVMLMGVEYLAKTIGTTDGRAGSVLQTMREAGWRADAIVRGLVDFSAPQRLELQSQDLNALVKRSLALVSHELLAHHVHVDRQLEPQLPYLRLDGVKIEQVFVNLFTNAAHAMDDGGMLTVRTYSRPGNPAGESMGEDGNTASKRVIIEVDDTGPGIGEDQLKRVFEPFFSTKSPGKGNGLGLSVARTIIAMHGGTITIRNRECGGARVTVTLGTP